MKIEQANKKLKSIFIPVLTLLILAIGIFFRLYMLGAQRLWLDELYTIELAQKGLSAIWENAFYDPWPLLSYLPYWIAGEIIGISPIRLKMVSVLASIITLLLFSLLSFYVLKKYSAITSIWILAISPLAIYYAQELRGYSIALMGAVLTMLAMENLLRKAGLASWGLYILSAIIASQFHYMNILLITGQLLAIFLISTKRIQVLIGSAATILLIALINTPFAYNAFTLEESGWGSIAPINILDTIQTTLLVQEQIASTSMRLVASGVILFGVSLTLINRKNWELITPYISQIAITLFSVFIVLPLLGKAVPKNNDRAFLILLPNFLIVFGYGIRPLWKNFRGRILIFCLILIYSSVAFVSLSTYYNRFTKSYEGVIIDHILPEIKSGDCAITNYDTYSVDAILQFYKNDLPVYRFIQEKSGNFYFDSSPSILLNRFSKQSLNDLEMVDFAQCNRIWEIHRNAHPVYLEKLLKEFKVVSEQSFGPFQMILLK